MTTTNLELKNREEIQQWIARRLGAPTVEVEITCEQYEDCIDDALRWFAAKKGERRSYTLNVQAYQGVYDLPEDVDTVLEVIPTANKLDFSLLLNPFTFLDEQQIPYNIYAAPTSGGLYSTLVQALQNVKMDKQIIGAEFNWRQEDRQLYVFPVPQATGNALIFYKTSYYKVTDLNERDHDLVKRYSLARAKEILGQVRSKYTSGFPTAQGTATLNGDALLGQAEKEMEKLEEEIALSAFPMGFYIG